VKLTSTDVALLESALREWSTATLETVEHAAPALPETIATHLRESAARAEEMADELQPVSACVLVEARTGEAFALAAELDEVKRALAESESRIRLHTRMRFTLESMGLRIVFADADAMHIEIVPDSLIVASVLALERDPSATLIERANEDPSA
jgi:hypothetical protein